jgi:quercetin dioxygenase-like cupin family protein
MSSVAVNLRQALDTIPDDQPFSLLGHHRCDEESMVGVITIHNTRPDSSWERHPRGDELLVILDGRMTMRVRQPDGALLAHELAPGHALLIPRGLPHTATLHTPSIKVLFVTPRYGTEEWVEPVPAG